MQQVYTNNNIIVDSQEFSASYMPQLVYSYLHLKSLIPTNITPNECNPAIELPMSNPNSAYEQIALNEIAYITDSMARSWIGQFAAYQYIGCDSDMIDSSVIIDSFVAMAGNSRYAYINNIENSITIGDFATASILLATSVPPLVGNGKYIDTITGVVFLDDSSSDYIITNYRMFYNTYINYINNSMSCVDSINLVYMANLCPSLYGTVVYQARSLFTAVFNQLHVWNDDSCFVVPDTNYCVCGRNGNNRFAKNKYSEFVIDSTQQYVLLPNPNNGNFILQQKITDNIPINAEIINEIGQIIFKKQINFNYQIFNINITNINTGIYILKMIDSKGRLFKIKFIVE